jgi:hypothetical protein
MSVTIELSSELDLRLREEAARLGIDPAEFVVQALRGRLESSASNEHYLNPTESDLLKEINCGLSQSQWQRYHALFAKRRDEQISDDELGELIATSDRIEQLNVQRLASLRQLAQLRGTTLPKLMDELGITRA